MDDLNDDPLEPLRRWCAEARRLLGLAKAAVEAAKGVLPNEPVKDGEPDLMAEATQVKTELGSLLKDKWVKNPPGALPAQVKRLDALRDPLVPKVPAKPNPKFTDADRLHKAGPLVDALVAELDLVVDEIARRGALKKRLAQIAPAGQVGAALVPGAAPDDTTTLEKLRDAAALLLADEVPAAAQAAVAAEVDKVSAARVNVEDLLARRRLRADEIKVEAATTLKAPDELPQGLDKEQGDLDKVLKTVPFSATALAQAEAALLLLRTAWAVVDKEARELHQMRLLFREDVRVLRERVLKFEAKLSSKQGSQKGEVKAILVRIDEAEAELAVGKTRKESEGCPALLELARQFFMMLVRGVLSSNNDSSADAALFLQEERKRLVVEMDELITPDATTLAHKSAAQKLNGVIVGLLGVGTAGQAIKAYPEIEKLAARIAQWRTDIGAAGIVLGQRKKVLDALLARPDPANCLPAFQAELLLARQTVQKPLAGPLEEKFVLIAEAAAPALTDLLLRASVDAKAGQQVLLLRATLDKDWTAVRNAARPAAQIELDKLRAPADADASRTDTGRDMAATVKQHDALLKRMLAVQAEPTYASVSAVLAGTLPNEPIRQQAYALCGPAALTALPGAAQTAFGQVLASDGPAIERLALKAFGGKPQIFTRVLADCGAAGLRAMARAFDGDTGTAALVTLLDDCGMAADELLLPTLMKEHGFNGDGDKLRQFADAFTGDAPGRAEERAGLKRITTAGGMAAHPKAFAPVIAGGGAAAVKKIGAAFVAPADLANLNNLLAGGGMGGEAGKPGKDHEHPDTLSKVFTEGLGGSGAQLKTYAAAFSGADGAAKSKEMLGAFNEYGPAHAAQRQPGGAVKRLLDGNRLQGTPEQRVQQLATKFVPQMRNIAGATQRKQAMRMAPHIGGAAAGPIAQSPAMNAAGYGGVTTSVSQRHKPETFDRAFAVAKGYASQTMYPPGVDVAALVDLAMAEVQAGRMFGKTAHAAVRDRVSIACPPTGALITVTVGHFVEQDGSHTINHFGPRNDPDPNGPALTNGPPHPAETPKFTAADMTAIHKAIGLLAI